MREQGQMHLLLAGGGTGGHIFPLAALHALLGAKDSQVQATYAGIRGRIDETIFSQLSQNCVLQAISQASGVAGVIRFALQTLRWTIYWLLRMKEFDLVAVSGGYGCVPAMLAGRISGTPVLVYEPNAVEGRASRLARRLGLSPLNPLSGACEPLVRPELYPAGACSGESLFIAGGSQGSLSLNRILLQGDTVEQLLEALQVQKVYWLTGETGFNEVVARYGTDARFAIHQYQADMPEAYRQARFAVARAGASSIFELAAWGIPALYVPLPWSADGHQLANAQHAASRGWGLVCEESGGPRELLAAAGTLAGFARQQDAPTLQSARDFWNGHVRAILEAAK